MQGCIWRETELIQVIELEERLVVHTWLLLHLSMPTIHTSKQLS